MVTIFFYNNQRKYIIFAWLKRRKEENRRKGEKKKKEKKGKKAEKEEKEEKEEKKNIQMERSSVQINGLFQLLQLQFIIIISIVTISFHNNKRKQNIFVWLKDM